MKIKMQVYISGTRNGEPWPAAGGTVDLPDHEAAKLCANGLATPVRSDEEDVEKRGDSEKRGPGRPRKAKATAAPGEKRGD